MARIVIVEDDATTARAIQRIATGQGMHDVHLESSAEDALEYLSAGGPGDLIITDILLPGMGGEELIRHLRDLNPELPIIAITGGRKGLPVALPINIAKAMGADRALQKPVHRKTLFDAITALLRA